MPAPTAQLAYQSTEELVIINFDRNFDNNKFPTGQRTTGIFNVALLSQSHSDHTIREAIELLPLSTFE
jgi:hypothetical protein